MSFDSAIAYVLANEGIDSNDPADKGGRTRFGVTNEEAGRHGLEVSLLTLAQAKDIYRVDYWKPQFDLLADSRVATKLFDMAVNMGAGTAVKLAQALVGVKRDGVFGPATVTAINAIEPTKMLSDLVEASVRRYIEIVLFDHSQLVFLRGWANRATKIPPLVT